MSFRLYHRHHHCSPDQLLTRAAALRRTPCYYSGGLLSSRRGLLFPASRAVYRIYPNHVHMTERGRRFLFATFTTTSKDSPTAPQSVWERTARKVQDTNQDRHNVYMEAIRATHDYPAAWQVQTIEDELKATIGQALGRQGRKLLTALQGMQREWQHYQELCRAIETTSSTAVTSSSGSSSFARKTVPSTNTSCANQTTTESNNNHVLWNQLHASVERYNALRQSALKARWELMVQRQAAGFLVHNHAYVTQQYPIPAALPLPSHPSNGTNNNNNTPLWAAAPPPEAPPPAQTALDWWQRVGRWK
jgi:hypothetical protein